MGEWQDIASAPKDGTDIIAYSAEYRKVWPVYFCEDDQWRRFDHVPLPEPTHWRPMPPPPLPAPLVENGDRRDGE